MSGTESKSKEQQVAEADVGLGPNWPIGRICAFREPHVTGG